MVTRAEMQKYTVNELGDFLSSKLDGKVDSPEYISLKFEENKISGATFLELSADDLLELVPLIGDRKAVKSILDSFTTSVVSKLSSLSDISTKHCSNISTMFISLFKCCILQFVDIETWHFSDNTSVFLMDDQFHFATVF